MDLTRYVEELRQQLTTTAELGGDDAVALAHKLAAHLDGSVRLVLFEALSAAADEITTDLAPGSVSMRLRGRDPEFEVVPPPNEVTSYDVTKDAAVTATMQPSEASSEADGGEIARITLRVPEQVKTRIEQAAASDRLSVNAWLARAVGDALETRKPDPRAAIVNAAGGQRLTGWAR
jgi:hypothetical protein